MRALVPVLVLAATAVALADPSTTIEEERNRANAEQLVASELVAMNTTCKTNVSDINVIDWATWKSAVDDQGNHAATQCRQIAAGAEALCRSDTIAQRAFAKGVTRIVCNGDGSGDLRFELKGTTLAVHTFLGAKETEIRTHRWLYANLKP
jgi:hypothetical protein